MSEIIEGEVTELSKRITDTVVFVTLLDYCDCQGIQPTWCASGIIHYSEKEAVEKAPSYGARQFCIVRAVIPIPECAK